MREPSTLIFLPQTEISPHQNRNCTMYHAHQAIPHKERGAKSTRPQTAYILPTMWSTHDDPVRILS